MLSYLLLSSLVMAQQADCPAPTSLQDFHQASAEGERAFADMDIEALGAARDAAMHALACLQEPLAPEGAAAFHRLLAMVAFTRHDADRVDTEFHAARRLEPGYVLPPEVAPEGHPLRKAYKEAAVADEGDLRPVNPPLGGWVVVDGVRGAPAPSAISNVIQVFDGDGAWQETRFLEPGDELPSWGPAPLDETGRQHLPLLAATGAMTVAAGGLYALAYVNHGAFEGCAGCPRDKLDRLALRTNMFMGASLAAGGLGLGLGGLTIWTW